MSYKYIKFFNEIKKDDLPVVGGKGANLGEMTGNGLPVPPGFCVTAGAYKDFIHYAELDEVVTFLIESLNVDDVEQLNDVSKEIRQKIMEAPILPELEEEIKKSYLDFSKSINMTDPEVAVRSSATAEDLPDASFAGQQDTYLHIRGEKELVNHVKMCWASLWTGRAIYYREKQHFDHFDVLLSAVVQKMVNAKKAGVMFTANPINKSTDEMMINSSWGLGEAVVSGTVTPDEYIIDKETKEIKEKHVASKLSMVVKKEVGVGTEVVNVEDYLGKDAVEAESLTREELNKLIEMGLKIENIYGSVQDTEWAFDKDTGDFYFLQSRPITTIGGEEKEEKLIPLCKGLPASPGIGRGIVKNIKNLTEISQVEEGDILVTEMTNPDMVPAMKKARAVVTDEGGRTCHAAIVSRELQIPCIVGAKNATQVLKDGIEVTVDATRGIVYKGNVLNEEVKVEEKSTEKTQTVTAYNPPITATKIYMNLGEPDLANKYKDLSFDGIGLMRTEFIFTNMIGEHPMYLLKTGRGNLMIDKLSEGISKVATAIFPRNVVVRMSDFRTNEFRGLKGGDEVEPIEQNPMIGWRGVSRYISPEYEEGFRLECKAIKRVREEYGLHNVIVMLPFVRTPDELRTVKAIMAEEGLRQSDGLKIWIMAEVPAVVFRAEEFAELVDGFSIGSNDLTQLIMGADRDNGVLNNMGYFDERNPSVKAALKTLIEACNKKGKTCSICGQGPSQYPELAEFLVECGITSISVNPDTVEYTRRLIASVEQKLILNKIRSL
ncbi:pyruvate, water dikinase [Peptoniphilus duerdenii ATCC BAA-1640]|uniref:Phosphoenolpyruvate synthase n=1 Tax=Peptoniphilus duerdenii ATCC BAA-1640 TaxID=862517 RepID=E0NNV1_9FIRM|nr:phosphoenolpyruvate synthase [Peptoniphilus duerdenii]EFM24419.1 pyruvate, water dikinase [Peptoniphilus duerdenii ATCC BAA-1640]